MNPAVQAVICGRRRVQVTKTFPIGTTTWTAPTTTSRIDSASGYGAAGAPGDPGTPDTTTTTSKQVTHNYRFLIRRDGTGNDTVDEGYTDGWPPGGTAYYDNYVTYSESDSTVYSGAEDYHAPETQTTTTTTPGTPATDPTTGAPTTAFGRSFPGGTGGAASVTTLTNLIVTPGASYSIVVPTGGSLTITYYQ
jgi:hypothetical protein